MESEPIDEEKFEAYKRLLAQRLQLFRAHVHLTQAELGENMGMSQNPVFRLEQQMKGGIETFLKVVFFYVEQYRINPMWLFLENNASCPMILNAPTEQEKRQGLLDQFLTELKNQNLIS